MALSGNYTHYTYEQHPTETITETVSYPADLPEGNENYDKRGTTEEVTLPLMVETPTLYENCIIGLRIANTYVTNNDGTNEKNKVVLLDYSFRLYDSLEDKENRYAENHIAEISNTCRVIDLSSNTNIWEYCYNDIKSSKGGSELTNI